MLARLSVGLVSAAWLVCAVAADDVGKDRTEGRSGRTPLFQGLERFGTKISSREENVQRFFDQGLVFTYGFNHAEAARSYREAAKLDPRCGICYWGVAYVLGPNINLPMSDDAVPQAWEAVQQALKRKEKASPREQALIDALAKRYAPEPMQDRSALDKAYADAMREVARQYPDDAEVQTFFAEALMDLSPWDYWTEEGDPKPNIKEAIAALKQALKLKPEHIGALHLYIHAIEASPEPWEGEDTANQLTSLAPSIAGHLVHMPAHIYIRIGRYHDAVTANVNAAEADRKYIAQCQAQGAYPLLYHPHNWHFLWAAATFEGNSAQAREAALKTRELMGTHNHGDPAMGGAIQHFWLVPVYDDVRFGRWDETLKSAEPKDLPYERAIWHYARGMAFGGKGDLDAAQRELESLRGYAKNPALDTVQISPRNTARQLVAVAAGVLEGDIHLRRKRYSSAIATFKETIELEDKLGYNEPEDWHYPVRLLLAAAQLEAGLSHDAEITYRHEMGRHPENPWALYGVAQSLKAQGKTEDADRSQKRFERGWKYADVHLTAPVIR